MKTALMSLMVVAVAGVPGVASASTISVNSGNVVYKAAVGEANNLKLTDPVGLTFADLGAPLSAGPGCTANPDATVTCPPTNIIANLGDQADAASVNAFVGLATVTINGNDGNDDILAGADGRAYANGNAGDDTLRTASNVLGTANGGAGNDTLIGGSSVNDLHGGAGNDTLSLSFSSSFSPDTLSGDAGADRLTGGAFDVLSGGDGNDVLTTGAELHGDNGNDQIKSTLGGAIVDGGYGNDTIDAADATGNGDTITCGPGRDTVYVDAQDSVAADCEIVRSGPAPAFRSAAAQALDAAAALAKR